MRRRTACALLVALLALAAGCGGGSSRDDAAAAARARAAARQARLVAAGRPVFVKRCASCHDIEGHKAHPTFIESPIPDLDEVKPRAEYVRERVESGGFDMPTISGELKAGQLEQVVAYVASVSGSKVVDTGAREASAVTAGRGVFRANCESCHSIAGRRATGTPAYPGTDFNRVKPSQKMVMERITSGIREEMPSFRGKLTAAQMHAVAVYVTATAGE
ncbi:MAG TPA: c-type cytochrome [Conexibacter sp.]|nr:c-type cytochrome [Conexibacter sp.]